jgi:hypothetical protein
LFSEQLSAASSGEGKPVPRDEDLAYSDADDDEDGESADEHDPGILLNKLHVVSPI